jgi:AbrB family looped-hinge helix DNA binding protein
VRVTIDRSGRIVIPKQIRDELRLQPGDELELTVIEGEVIRVTRPARPTS